MLPAQLRLRRFAFLWLCFALVCAGLGSAFAPSVSAADKPPAPENVRVIATTHNSITIDWDNIEGVDPYATGYWVAPGGWNSGDGEMTIGGLDPDTEYSISVGANVTEANVTTITARTLPAGENVKPDAPLTAPQALKVTDISETAVSLSWTGSPGATGYDIYVNDAWSGGTWDVNATAFTYEIKEPLAAGAELKIEVAAQNLPEVSEKSNAVKLVWGELAAPADLQVVSATRTTAAIAWAQVPGATAYKVFRNNVYAGKVTENRFVSKPLVEGTAYTYHVEAVNPLWESPASETLTVVPGAEYNHITYFTSWSIFGRDFHPEDVDVSEITHINYAFADLCWDGFTSGGKACQNDTLPLQKEYVHDGVMIIGDPEADPANYAAFAEIKEKNPHLKMMVSVGGWSWSNNFSNMAAAEETRRAFAASAVKYLREYKLDGLDIDWEYPVEGGEEDNSRSADDKANYVLLMKTVREALDAAGSEDGKYYLLTIASGASDSFVNNADLAESSKYLDFINIMTYDFSGSWETTAHHNSPVYYDVNHPYPAAAKLTTAGAAIGHLNGGVPNHKLVIGVPFYGKGWLGCEPGGQYQQCEGAAAEGFGTWEARAFDIADIEDNYLTNEDYVHYWNDASKISYLYNEENGAFITYNDKQTMKYTASLVKSLDVAGVMSWEISSDRNGSLTGQLSSDLPADGTIDADALPAPAHVELVSESFAELGLAWEAVEGAGGYDIYLNGYQWVGYTEETQAIIGELTPGTEYSISVVAVSKDEAGEAVKVSAASEPLQAATLGFHDALPAWAEPSIHEAVALGLVTGINEKEFGAELAITQGELVSIFSVMLGIEPSDAEALFMEGMFDPEGELTREQFAVIIANALKAGGIEAEADLSVLDAFGDRAQIAPAAEEPLALLVQNGIVNGVNATELAPKATLTRAQSVVVAIRMLQALHEAVRYEAHE